MSKTVFFGPFVGELGWEFLYWHAWVRKVSLTRFKDHHKVVSSFPGREPFYPQADGFWPHPQHLLDALRSPRNYITDYWRNGLPRGNALRSVRRFGILPSHKWERLDPTAPAADVEPIVLDVLESYRSRLPEDTEYFVPFHLNRYEDQLVFGVEYPGQPSLDRDFRPHPIPLGQQQFDTLHPSPLGVEKLRKMVAEDQRLVCLFPRNRLLRRPDKNWPREKYVELVQFFQAQYPSLTVAIVGAPGDAYFDDGAPAGCLNLVNLPSENRLDIQVAALKQSKLALGSSSGAISVALAAGCPALTWGWARDSNIYHEANLLNTRFVYHPSMGASVAEIESLASAMIEGRIPPPGHQATWDSVGFLSSGSLLDRANVTLARSQAAFTRVMRRLRRPVGYAKRQARLILRSR